MNPFRRLFTKFLYSLAVHYFIFFSPAFGIYLSASPPVHYCEESEAYPQSCKSDVPLYVNRLNSENLVLPYEYHYFDFCTSETDESESPEETLGQVIFGERIHPSSYKISFLKNERCKKLCTKSYKPNDGVSDRKLSLLKRGMSLNYQHHWIVDNMPVTWCYPIEDSGKGSSTYCTTGFPMGCFMTGVPDLDGLCVSLIGEMSVKAGKYYLFNHVDLKVIYHSGKDEEWGSSFKEKGGRIIAVKVTPRSIKHPSSGSLVCEIGKTEPMSFDKEKLTSTVDVTYSYSVTFEENNTVKWSSRWDYILEISPQTNIQLWFSICISLMIVFFLIGMVTKIIMKTVPMDIVRYHEIDYDEDAARRKFRWILIQEDVFRPPKNGMLLSVFLGSGVQILCTTVVTLVIACFGFLSPANRGYLETFALYFYVVFGVAAGYVSARTYTSFGGKKFICNAALTASLVPSIVFGVFFWLNLLLWVEDSSGAVPLTGLIALLALWSCTSLPLTFVGAVFGFRKRAIEHSVQSNQNAKEIPKQSFFQKQIPGIVMGGVLPFGCIFIQLYFILNGIWSNQIYYIFGFLFLTFIMLTLTCSGVTILLCNFHLRSGDYNWWWRSFFTSGFTAVYVFLYCIHYFNAKMNADNVTSTILFYGYTFIMVFSIFLLTGCIGFFACFLFVRKIYSHQERKVKKIFNVQDYKTEKKRDYSRFPDQTPTPEADMKQRF